MKNLWLKLHSNLPHFWFCFIALALIASYFPLIISDPILNYDDSEILRPLYQIASLSDYFQLREKMLIYDFQPIRDLSLIIDLKIKGLLPWYSLHAMNVIIWIISLFLFKKILSFFSKDSLLVGIILVSVAFASYNTSSVAWISARKHLLSNLFIMLATYLSLFELNPRRSFLICLSFLMASLAQPICLLWPFWFFVFKFKKSSSRPFWTTFLFLSLIFLVISYLNVDYYSNDYKALSAGTEFDPPFDLDSLSLVFLSLGRYFFQVLIPFFPNPMPHSPGSILNIIGLFLLIPYVALFRLFKTPHLKILFLISILYFFLPLIVVQRLVHRMFNSDTYLLNASFGFYLSLLFLFLEFNIKKGRIALLALSLCIFSFNLFYVQQFSSTEKLSLYSFNQEPSSLNAIAATQIYIDQGDFSKAEGALGALHVLDPNNFALPGLASKRIFKNPEIPLEKKISRLEVLSPKTPATYFYLSHLYALTKNNAKLGDTLFRTLSLPALFIIDFGPHSTHALASTFALCESINYDNCRFKIDEFRSKLHFSDWNEESFLKLVNDFRNGKEINF